VSHANARLTPLGRRTLVARVTSGWTITQAARVGAAHARRRILAIIDEQEVTVVALDTGEVLSVHRIEPDKGYWRNQRRDPGRWPGSS